MWLFFVCLAESLHFSGQTCQLDCCWQLKCVLNISSKLSRKHAGKHDCVGYDMRCSMGHFCLCVCFGFFFFFLKFGIFFWHKLKMSFYLIFSCLKNKFHIIKHFFLNISMVVCYRMCSGWRDKKNLSKDVKRPRPGTLWLIRLLLGKTCSWLET